MKWVSLLVLGASIGSAATAVAAQTAPAAAPASSADTEAQAILTNTCTACHDLGVLTARPHRADEWPGILQQMISNGANLSDDQKKVLQTYLAANYSAAH